MRETKKFKILLDLQRGVKLWFFLMIKIDPASFRDNAGFVFVKENEYFRAVNKSYQNTYDAVKRSGLYQKLVDLELLIPHEEVDFGIQSDATCLTIKPRKIPFISYPSEWCAEQLQSAAIVTLKIQSIALDFGFTLKDANCYNIQFIGTKAILIDTLSFEKYVNDEPWIAYRQFCEHFLSPLTLMQNSNVTGSLIFGNSIDGINLKIASKLLPWKTWLNISILLHIHFQSFTLKGIGEYKENFKNAKLSLNHFKNIIKNLYEYISKMKFPATNGWLNYKNFSNYTNKTTEIKEHLISNMLEKIEPQFVIDIGSNTGRYSMIASKFCDYVISIDNDMSSVSVNFTSCATQKIKNILPLVVDITNPTPGVGWFNSERASFLTRLPKSTCLALAVVHHIVISRGLSFEKVAEKFSAFGEFLIIEFPDVMDSQVRSMLTQNSSAGSRYTKHLFYKGFSKYYDILQTIDIDASNRTLFLMKVKNV